ncbi:hypothetical protein [Desulforamulus reducens]|nr:hypothetical protein [Desulforamulus reducens]
MKKISPVIITTLILLTCFTGTSLATEATTTGPEIGTGLPTVTSEEFTDKIGRIVAAIYKDAKEISPMLTLGIVTVCAVFSIFFKAARIMILWSVASMLLILWGPQFISLIQNYVAK